MSKAKIALQFEINEHFSKWKRMKHYTASVIHTSKKSVSKMSHWEFVEKITTADYVLKENKCCIAVSSQKKVKTIRCKTVESFLEDRSSNRRFCLSFIGQSMIFWKSSTRCTQKELRSESDGFKWWKMKTNYSWNLSKFRQTTSCHWNVCVIDWGISTAENFVEKQKWVL